MSKTFEETAENISLHGLGFLQIKLGGNQRLHVWHPHLPRRRCFMWSSVHDHRFGFESRVLVGTQVNMTYAPRTLEDDTMEADHLAYLHEGKRLPTGNRPWIEESRVWLGAPVSVEVVRPGETYHMLPYVFHRTLNRSDGAVATLMTKKNAGSAGARTLMEMNHGEPHVDFDRRQLTVGTMWRMVQEVLGDCVPG